MTSCIASVCWSGFCWPSQICVRRYQDMDSTSTLVLAFITSHVDYCNAVLAGSLRSVTDRLHCLLNTTAHIITGTHKFDHDLSQLLHDDLQCLNVSERIKYNIGVTVHWSSTWSTVTFQSRTLPADTTCVQPVNIT